MNAADLSIEQKIDALYALQKTYSEIDRLRRLRGELPEEVRELEDSIAGLETRMQKLEEEKRLKKSDVAACKNKIVETENLIRKYEAQKDQVRNSREYDSITKEIEYQGLEKQAFEKKITKANEAIEEYEKQLLYAKEERDDRLAALETKKDELVVIEQETHKEEEVLLTKVTDLETMIEPRLLTAFHRIRGNARNGLAVVTVQREACGGCNANIPPQRQLDIRSRKKIIVCEYCGRMLVFDPTEEVIEEPKKEVKRGRRKKATK